MAPNTVLKYSLPYFFGESLPEPKNYNLVWQKLYPWDGEGFKVLQKQNILTLITEHIFTNSNHVWYKIKRILIINHINK